MTQKNRWQSWSSRGGGGIKQLYNYSMPKNYHSKRNEVDFFFFNSTHIDKKKKKNPLSLQSNAEWLADLL